LRFVVGDECDRAASRIGFARSSRTYLQERGHSRARSQFAR
jgi:hypothetical protein